MREVSGYKMPLGGVPPGNYDVEFWDTATATVSSRKPLEIRPDTGIIDLPIPTFKRDFALKVIRKK